jgi:hypothetical protein
MNPTLLLLPLLAACVDTTPGSKPSDTAEHDTASVDTSGHDTGTIDTSGRDTASADSGGDTSVDTGGAETGHDTAVSGAGWEIRLTWTGLPDLDLHVMDTPDSLFLTPHDCNFCNTDPAWGAAGTADDPSLDLDARMGPPGEEVITIDSPAAGTYYVAVHYFEDNGGASVDATVEVLSGSVSLGTTTLTLDADDAWTAGTVSVPDMLFVAGVDAPVPPERRTCE